MKIKKRGLLLASILLTGLLGVISGTIRLPFSKSDSALKRVAKADAPGGGSCDYRFWTQAQCDCYFLGVGCSGSDGAGDCCGGGCFPAKTLVSTPSGTKEIQAIEIGDEVKAFDSETGTIAVAKVIKTMRHSWDEVATRSPLIIVTHERGVITLTANHPVYQEKSMVGENKHFIEAGQLKIGDKLTLESGEISVVTSIEKGPVYELVYNFEVENAHTYIASNVRVHNKDACGSCGGGDY